MIFFLVFKRLPFDWKTPIGYIITLAFLYATTFFALSCLIPILSLVIGCGWFALIFTEEIQNDVKTLNKICQKSSDKKHKKHRNIQKFEESFIIIMQDYSALKELSNLTFSIIEKMMKNIFFYSKKTLIAVWSAHLLKRLDLISPFYFCGPWSPSSVCS